MKTLMYFFVMAIILIAGCAKDDTLFENPENINDQDLMLKSGKPAQPGDNLKVFRYEGRGAGYAFYDEETDLTAYVGFDVRQLYSGGALASYDVLNIQEIAKEGNDGEFNRAHILVNQDDVTTEVWKGLISYPSQLFSSAPVYSGTGHLVYTNSDFFNDNDDKNAGVLGLKVNGEGINIKFHMMWHGDDPAMKVNTIIMLKN